MSDVAARGERFLIRWATDQRGRQPAREFFDTLKDADKAKVASLFRRFAEHGEIRNREKFKKVEGSQLFEFKSFQIRFLGDYRPNGEFVVAHGLKKKKHKLKPSDIERAQRILDEHDARQGGGR